MTSTALYEKLSLAMKSCSYIEKQVKIPFMGILTLLVAMY